MLRTKQSYAKPDQIYLDDMRRESVYEDQFKRDRVIRVKSKINDVVPEKPNYIDRKDPNFTAIDGPRKNAELNRFSTFNLIIKV